jgi:cytochrome c oxidase subunit 2
MMRLLPIPPEASAHAAQVDLLAGSFAALVFLLAAPVFALIVYFGIRYRRGSAADRSARSRSNVWLETSWSLIPFLLMLGFFGWGTALFFRLHEPPPDPLVVHVVARQWMWKFQHEGGQREINALHVPVNRPIELRMISQDVIHSLYLPALRIKQDVLPGRYASIWFQANRSGIYPLRCAEFCGADHSGMGGSFVVMTPTAYAAWLDRSRVDRDLAAQGAQLFRRFGCSGCHGAGSSVHAPPLAGLYGSPVPLADGRVVKADEQYVRDSIVQPNRDIAAGYAAIMPTFGNLLDEGQLVALTAYVKSLGDEPSESRP